MDKSRDEMVFCPEEQDVVHVHGKCEYCEFWEGGACSFLDCLVRGRKGLRGSGGLLRRWRKLRRSFGKRGRGLRVPSVWESWPHNGPDSPDILAGDEVTDYGIAGLAAYEEPRVIGEKKKKYVLPELIKEEWDVEPDVPDWGPEPELMATPEPGQLPGVLPENPQSDMLAPGLGEVPGMESPQDAIPGFPPDPFNGPMP